MSIWKYLVAILKSFYSRSFYLDVGRNWQHGVFAYFFLVILLATIPSVYQMQHYLNQTVPATIKPYLQQLPSLKIQGGVLSTPENHRYTIYTPDTHEPYVVIDESVDSLHAETGVAPYFITKDGFLKFHDKGEPSVYHWNDDTNLVITGDSLHAFFMAFLPWTWVMFMPLILLFVFGIRLLEGLILSISTWVLTLVLGVDMRYPKMFRITLVALTPSIVLSAIINYFHIATPETILLFVLAQLYIFFGVYANRRD